MALDGLLENKSSTLYLIERKSCWSMFYGENCIVSIKLMMTMIGLVMEVGEEEEEGQRHAQGPEWLDLYCWW